MKPTITDELIACILQLDTDIEEITDILEYIQPVKERLHTLAEILKKARETA